MATRQLTGTILHADGSPWAGASVKFSMWHGTYSALATYPEDHVTVTAEDGTLSVELEAGLATKWQCLLPSDRFNFVLPEGATPVSIEELRAVASIPEPITSTVQTAIDAAKASFTADVDALTATVDGFASDLAGKADAAALGTLSNTVEDLGDTVATGDGEAQVTGLSGWAFDPVSATVALALPAAGVLATAAVRISRADALRRVWWQTATAGSGLVNSWIGIYNAAGALIEAIDAASQLSSTGNKALSLAADYPVAPGDLLTVAVLWNGSSGPSLRGHSGTGIVTIGGVSRWRTGGSGLTALPSTLPALAAVTTPWWFGVGVI